MRSLGPLDVCARQTAGASSDTTATDTNLNPEVGRSRITWSSDERVNEFLSLCRDNAESTQYLILHVASTHHYRRRY